MLAQRGARTHRHQHDAQPHCLVQHCRSATAMPIGRQLRDLGVECEGAEKPMRYYGFRSLQQYGPVALYSACSRAIAPCWAWPKA
jgi:hypothetical protein